MEHESLAATDSPARRCHEGVGLKPLAVGGFAVLAALDGGVEFITGAPPVVGSLRELTAALLGLAAYSLHWLDKNS